MQGLVVLFFFKCADGNNNVIRLDTVVVQTETRKAELETNLSTNLKRRKQELEATIASVESDMVDSEAESKIQELNDAKSLVAVTSEELKSEL